MKVNYKAITTIPGWASEMLNGEDGQKDDITTTSLAHAYVPLIQQALRLRCNAIIKPRMVIYKDKKEVEWPFEVDPEDLIWKTEASLLLTGAGYNEKIIRKNSKKTIDLRWVNPTDMTVNYTNNEYGFQQGKGSIFTLDDMVYMREFSLLDDVKAGDSAAGAALTDAALLRYMGRFAQRFFQGGAMPVTIVGIDGIDEDEAKRVTGRLKRMMNGIKRAFNTLVVNSSIKPEVISHPLKDLVMPELYDQALSNVGAAFGIPISMLTDSSNRAQTEEHRLSFWQDTVEPRGKWIAGQYNRQVFKPLGLRMEFMFNELDIFQEDEEQRAGSVQTLTSAINENPAAAYFVMQVLGYDLTEEQIAEYNKLFLLHTESGESLPEQSTAMAIDLDKWMRKSVKQLQRGKGADCKFESDHITGSARMKIARRLPGCKSEEDIRTLFTSLMADEQKDEEVKQLIEAMRIEMKSAQQPMNITVNNMPQEPANVKVDNPVTVNMPEQKEHIVNVNVEPTEVKAEFAQPSITVNIPEQQPPSVTVNVPEQKEPIVNVTNEVKTPDVTVNNEVKPADLIINAPKQAVLTDQKGKVVRRLMSE